MFEPDVKTDRSFPTSRKKTEPSALAGILGSYRHPRFLPASSVPTGVLGSYRRPRLQPASSASAGDVYGCCSLATSFQNRTEPAPRAPSSLEV